MRDMVYQGTVFSYKIIGAPLVRVFSRKSSRSNLSGHQCRGFKVVQEQLVLPAKAAIRKMNCSACLDFPRGAVPRTCRSFAVRL
eukprot:5177805-Alexandrium_andersonii.AAC.1